MNTNRERKSSHTFAPVATVTPSFARNAQPATGRNSGPTVAPRRVCREGNQKTPLPSGSSQNPPLERGRGNSRATQHSLFF